MSQFSFGTLQNPPFTSTRAPVFGFRPMRAGLSRVRKLPKPRISTLSPCSMARTMLSRIHSTVMVLPCAAAPPREPPPRSDLFLSGGQVHRQSFGDEISRPGRWACLIASTQPRCRGECGSFESIRERRRRCERYCAKILAHAVHYMSKNLCAIPSGDFQSQPEPTGFSR